MTSGPTILRSLCTSGPHQIAFVRPPSTLLRAHPACTTIGYRELAGGVESEPMALHLPLSPPQTPRAHPNADQAQQRDADHQRQDDDVP